MNEHTCACVRIGRDIGVRNMGDLERLNRNGLDAGFVSDTPSADRDCSVCHGFGSRLLFLENFYWKHKREPK